MAYYFSAQISIHDPDEYERYLETFDAIFSRHRGKILAVDESPTVLEGEWKYTKSVLIRFDSRSDFEDWYFSKDYQQIIKYRLNAAKCDSILIEGYE